MTKCTTTVIVCNKCKKEINERELECSPWWTAISITRTRTPPRPYIFVADLHYCNLCSLIVEEFFDKFNERETHASHA